MYGLNKEKTKNIYQTQIDLINLRVKIVYFYVNKFCSFFYISRTQMIRAPPSYQFFKK